MSKTTVALFVAGLVSLAGIAQAQALTEFGAVAGGAAVGGAAGKAVTNALTNTLGAVDRQTSEAAKTDAPALEVGPAQTKTTLETVKSRAKLSDAAKKGHSSAAAAADKSNESSEPPMFAQLLQLPEPPDFLTAMPSLSSVMPSPAPLPPPEMTADTFKTVSSGMSRADLLRMGPPAFKVTMDQAGHLVETYSYHQAGARIGSVQLVDGAVSAAGR